MTAKTCNECSREVNRLRLGLCGNCYGRKRRREGYRCTYVDADPVRAHLRMLLASGVRVYHIAKATGLTPTGIYYILNGRPSQGLAPAARVSRNTAECVYAVLPPPKDLRSAS